LHSILFVALVILAQGQAFGTETEHDALPTDQLYHRPRIAVVNFEVTPRIVEGLGNDRDTVAARLSKLLSDMFISTLVKSGSFDVIERTELDKVLKEQKLGEEALLDPKTAPRVGRILGVDYILGGMLTEFGIREERQGGFAVLRGFFGVDVRTSTARVVVDARMVQTTTAKITLAETGVGENAESRVKFADADVHHFILGADVGSKEWADSRIGRATRDAVAQIATAIIGKYPLRAVVMAVLEDGSVILDRGALAGVKIDDRFELQHIAQIRNPDTDEIIYEDTKPLGILRVVNIQENGCKAVFEGAVAAGITPKVNDIATPIKPQPRRR